MKIYTIGNLPENEYPNVGGKARGLDFLKKNNFTVPDGFIIADIDSDWEKDFYKIKRQFEALDAERVSVRSSASNEDGQNFSNAGQYKTRLDVTADGLFDAVTECLASLHDERAIAYSVNFLGGGTAKMNLVVQTMADAKYAGVMFTSDPSDKDNVLIEAVAGAGENLVSGVQSSHSYSVSKKNFTNVSDGMLTGEQLETLYREGLQIAKRFGNEADLEWVIGENGKLYWLQVRPITTLADIEDDEFDCKNPLENHLLTTRNIGEMMPGAVTPLSISTSVLAIDYGIRNMLYKIGSIKRIDAKPDFYTAFAFKHHLFIDMTALHGMSKQVALVSPPAMNLSIMGEYIEDYPEIAGKNAFFLVKLINACKFGKYIFSSKKAKKNLKKLSDNLTIDDKATAKELYEEISSKLPAINEALCYHYVCSSFSGAMNSGLYMTLAKNFKDVSEYQSFISAALSDIDGIESADILSSLKKIAEASIKKDPEAVNFTETELLDFVRNKNNETVNALYSEFLEKHGHRSIKEAEMRSKAWKNDQLSLMSNLKTVMYSLNVKTEKKPPFDLDKFINEYDGKGKGALKFLLPRARQAVVDREFSKSNIIKIIDKFKDKYISLSKKLVDDGLLADEDCIYFLTHEEIKMLINGDISFKRKALLRRSGFAEYEELSFDDICVGKPAPIESAFGKGENELKGIPVSRGKVSGVARVVRCAADAEKLKSGEIMVAAFTDIGWSPYYSLVGALITEVGSALSHGAVVAREYCLPTVVNVKNATKIIKDGDRLLVNATAGTVSIISNT